MNVNTIKTLRDSQIAYRYALSLLKTHEQRLHWSKEIIKKEKLRRIKSLVSFCKEHSLWHQQRLTHIEAQDITLENFHELPSMTKADLMENWDDIVTDKMLNLNDLEMQIANSAVLNEKYNFVVTGGSSGKRGIFVYDIAEWAQCYCASIRSFMPTFKSKILSQNNIAIKVTIAAPLSNHMTSNLTQNFHNSKIKDYYLPVTEKIETIVATLNKLQPHFLQGYPTIIAYLTEQQAKGNLRINPSIITTLGESLYSHVKEKIKQTWNCTVFNVWACGEAGVLGMNCASSDDLHLCEDMHHLEAHSDKILITNLFSKTLPLLRYEIDDEVTLIDKECQCGSSHQLIKEIQGRSSENFIYDNNIIVHPIIFRSILHKISEIHEFQIFQIKNGIHLKLVVNSEFNSIEEIRNKILKSLASLDLQNPIVQIEIVGKIKNTVAGKIKRYIPLSGKEVN